MKTIEVEDDLYRYIAGQTEHIGESASAILRRLLGLDPVASLGSEPASTEHVAEPSAPVVQAAAKPVPQAATTVETPAINGQDFQQLLKDPQIAQQKAAVGRFLYLLAQLHQRHPATFGGVLDIRGRDRIYFADSEASLLAAGPSSNPKQIQDSPYWVMTNSNTGKKRGMLVKVLNLLGCDADLAKEISELV